MFSGVRDRLRSLCGMRCFGLRIGGSIGGYISAPMDATDPLIVCRSVQLPRRVPIASFVQIDEALVGGKGSPHKELVLVAAEADGRVRLAHAENNDEGTLKSFADSQIALHTQVVTDGLASYNSESLGQRPHQAVIQTKQERRESDALQGCHWTVSLLKRWLLGTHAGAVKPKHLQAYLDEFAFRFNRRKTNGVGRIAARTIEQLVARPPLTMKMLIRETVPCRAFRS